MVNLNTASKTRLMTLPGVGEATADRILQHRTRSPFSRPEDLMLVKGIGEKRFERIRPFVSAP
jgi:competence protein ComEA